MEETCPLETSVTAYKSKTASQPVTPTSPWERQVCVAPGSLCDRQLQRLHSMHNTDQTLKNFTRKKIKNNNNHDKERKPRSGSVYKLPVFSTPALNAPVFAVISPGWVASKFLHPAWPLPFTKSVQPVDAITEISPPLQLGHPPRIFYFNPPLPFNVAIR